MKAKKHVLISLFLVFALVLAACSGGNTGGSQGSGNQGGSANNGSSNSGNTGGGASSGEVVEIDFMHWRAEDKEVLDEMIKKFHEEHPNIRVTQTIFPSQEYLSTAQQRLLDGSSGDVFTVFPGAQFNALQSAGLMEDLSGKPVVDRFVPTFIEPGAKDGKQYALSYHLVYNMPIINVKMFNELGIEYPTNWDSYLEAGRILRENGYIPIAFPGGDIGQGQLMNPMLMNENTDPEMFPKLVTGETSLTDDWYVSFLEKWKQLNDNKFFQDNPLGTKYDAAITLFVTEQAAMLGTGSFHSALVLEQAPDMELDLLPPITVNEDEVVYEGVHNTTFMLAINSNSKHKEEAEIFIEFLAAAENASYYANNTGQMGTVTGLEYTDPSLKFKTDWPSKNTRFLPRSTIPNSAIESAITASIDDVLTGVSPSEAAAKAQEIVEQNKN